MKWMKRYSFLIMIIATSLGFGSGKVISAIEKQETALVETQQDTAGQEMAQLDENITDVEIEGVTEAVTQENEKQEAAETTQKGENAADKGKDQEAPKKPKKSKKKKFKSVELDYFKDALFIGDSRTDTLYRYAGWEETDFFVKTGMGIWQVWEKTMDGKYLEEMLSEKQYGKIYIMLGINELEMGTPETFRMRYESVLARIRELQPDALIFVQAIIHVTAKKDAEGTYINNQEIDIRNAELKKLTDKETIFWLNANKVLDEKGTGALNSEYTFDGVHLKVKYIDVWQEYLLKHGI